MHDILAFTRLWRFWIALCRHALHENKESWDVGFKELQVELD